MIFLESSLSRFPGTKKTDKTGGNRKLFCRFAAVPEAGDNCTFQRAISTHQTVVFNLSCLIELHRGRKYIFSLCKTQYTFCSTVQADLGFEKSPRRAQRGKPNFLVLLDMRGRQAADSVAKYDIQLTKGRSNEFSGWFSFQL